MKQISLNDITLAVHDTGSGPALLFVHGFPLDHSMWRHQLEHFEASHRVIAPDLRGFGRSGVTPGTVSMAQMADDLAALLDELEVRDPVTFCGLSMGGYVAWQFWKRHADRLARLILCDTRAIADTPEAAAGRRKLADRVVSKGARIVADAMVPKLFAEATPQSQPALADELRNVMLDTDPESIAAASRGMADRPDFTSELGNIRTPTLVLCGQHDQISTPDEMRAISDGLPNSHFVEIHDAGHMAPLEQPEAVNAAIQEFVR